MSNSNQPMMIPDEIVMNKIFLIRGQKVMIDSDLADLYGVETKRINEQVKRNEERFPEDFMFQLTLDEFDNLKSQFATSSWGGRRTLPYAFTEHGILMLSSVLKSKTAIQVNIHIVRVFVKIRKMIQEGNSFVGKIQSLELKVGDHERRIRLILEYLKELESDKQSGSERSQRVRIGFKQGNT